MVRMVAVVAAAAVVALAGCGSGQSHAVKVAACKTAMRADFRHALAHPSAPAATEPAACKGLSAAVVRRLAGQILAGD